MSEHNKKKLDGLTAASVSLAENRLISCSLYTSAIFATKLRRRDSAATWFPVLRFRSSVSVSVKSVSVILPFRNAVAVSVLRTAA